MKQLLFFLIFFGGLSQFSSAQITFRGCVSALGAQDYTLFATGTTNDAGTIRNTFESTPADFTQSCPVGVCEIRIMWNIGAARWEISLDNDGPLGTPDYTTLCLYFNTSPSFPNPPDLTLGSWQDCSGGLCPAAQMTIMSGDVQNAISSGTPEIDVIGNALSIVDGDITPSTTDDTDFGNVITTSNDIHTFTIDNTAGTANLDISTIIISGAHAGDFTIGGITLPASIASGATTTFTVTFAPSAVGARDATVTVNNNDANEAVYDFALRGIGVAPATAIDFDGANDVITGTAPNLQNADFTIEFWAKRNNTATQGLFLIGTDGINNGAIFMYMFNNGGLAFGFWGDDLNINQGSGLYMDLAWNHYALSYNATTRERKVYRNGVLIGSDIALANFIGNTNLMIGQFGGHSRTNGAIDEFRIWNRVLDPCEINARKDCELTGSEPGLLTYFNFNQGIAGGNNAGLTTANEFFGNNGTLSGFALNGSNSNWIVGATSVSSTSCTPYTPATGIDVQTAVGSYIWIDGITYYADNNTATHTLTSWQGCDSLVTLNLTITCMIDQPVSAAQSSVCNGGSTTIDIASSELGVNYYLRDDATNTVIAGPIAGTGAALSLPTGAISSATTYNVLGEIGVSGAGTALDFDGINDHVVAPSVNIANSDFTIEFWSKRSSTGTNDCAISHGNSSGVTNQSLHLQFTGGNFLFNFYANDLVVPVPQDVNWHYWACTYNATTNTQTIYRDGVAIGSRVASADYIGVGPLTLGNYFDGGLTHIYHGQLDEVKVWNKALSLAEVNANMNGCLLGNEPNLIRYYDFEDGTGSSTLSDGTAGANHGTLTNMDPATDWVVGQPISCVTCQLEMTQLATVTIAGPADIVRGNAISFDGANDFVNVPNGESTLDFERTSPATFEAWINTNATNMQPIASKVPGGFGDWRGWEFGYINNNIYFFLNSSWGAFNTLSVTTTSSAVSVGSWHHVVVSYDGSSDASGVSIYVDGIAQPFQIDYNGLTGTTLNNTWDPRIGARVDNSLFFNGSIDEVRIWDVARTEQEIRENMHLTLPSCEAGLKAYYQMNEGAGTTVADKTGNSNTGTLTNGPTWATSEVNVGNDVAAASNSVTISTVAAGASSQNFGSANLNIEFIEHSAVEDYTVTYEAFTPNTTNGAIGTTVFDNPMWTVNKSTSTATQKMDLTFNFPSAPLSSLDPTKYRLYWRPMNGEGDWSLLNGQASNVLSASQIEFSSIYVTGQFMIVKASEAQVTDVRGNMYTFDGVDDYIATAAFDFSAGNTMTIEAWIKAVDITTNSFYEISRQHDAAGFDWLFSFQDFGTILSFGLNTTTGYTELDVPIVAANFTNGWHHVAAVYNGTTKFIYVDGVLIGTEAKTGTVLKGANTHDLGRLSFGGEFFNGSMDEVRFWSTARTQNEIRENMHLTLKGNELGLVSYYQFNVDDALGTAGGVKDAMGTHHGTTQGMTVGAYSPSEVAVAGGVSQRMTISAAGAYNFDTPDVGITFSGNPNGEIVVSRLEVEKPTGWAAVGADVDNEYFVVWNYGTNATPGVTSMQFDRISNIASTTLTDIALYKRGSRDYGSTWGTQIATASALTTGGAGSATFTGAPLTSGFSQFVIVNTSLLNDLPIELLTFDAERSNSSTVALTWSTASELNNKGFFVERMLEGETEFAVVQWVDGFGTTSETTHYEINDENSFTGNSYYRLRQVDFDETESLSEIRAVRGSVFNEFTNVSLYPVPVSNELSVRFSKLPKGVSSGEVRIIDLQGRILFDAAVAVQSNQVLLIEEVAQWPAGMYMLQIRLDNGSTMMEKFVKE